MRRVLFEWRGIKIYSYPAMMYVGLVFGVIGGTYGAARRGVDPGRVYTAMLLLVLPALVGSRLLFVATNWKAFSREPGRIWLRSEGGAAQYGGLVLAFLVSLPLLTGLGISIGAFWDAATLTILIGMIFTRVGCLLNGCCAGRPSDGFLAICLPNIRGVWCRRLPTQLLEAGLAAVLLAGSVFAWDRLPFDGALFLGNLAGYGIGRWWLEMTRESIDRVGNVRLNRAISAGLVAISLGIFLAVWLVSPALRLAAPPGAARLAHAPAIGATSAMSFWYFLLAPLAVLAVLSLFRFVGCAEIAGLGGYEAPTVDYHTMVIGEMDNATPPKPAILSYWRLQEPANTAIPPGHAADEMIAANFGIYTRPAGAFVDVPADFSPAASTAVPQRLRLGQAGLLELMTGTTSMEVFGGHMEVPHRTTPSYALPSFTLEVMVFPVWDMEISPTKPGRFFAVFEAGGPLPPKKFGFGLYAGPGDPLNPTTMAFDTGKYHWQVWMGDGTKFVQVVVGAEVVQNKNTYLAVQYDADPAKKRIAIHTYFQDYPDIDATKFQTDGVTYAPDKTSALPLLIGVGRSLFTNNSNLLYPFHGRIQEVAIYKIPLTDGRVRSHIVNAVNLF